MIQLARNKKTPAQYESKPLKKGLIHGEEKDAA